MVSRRAPSSFCLSVIFACLTIPTGLSDALLIEQFRLFDHLGLLFSEYLLPPGEQGLAIS